MDNDSVQNYMESHILPKQILKKKKKKTFLITRTVFYTMDPQFSYSTLNVIVTSQVHKENLKEQENNIFLQPILEKKLKVKNE